MPNLVSKLINILFLLPQILFRIGKGVLKLVKSSLGLLLIQIHLEFLFWLLHLRTSDSGFKFDLVDQLHNSRLPVGNETDFINCFNLLELLVMNSDFIALIVELLGWSAAWHKNRRLTHDLGACLG